MVLKTLENPLYCKEIRPVHPKEISPECSLIGLRLKLKLQYFHHLIQRADSFEKTLKLGMMEGYGHLSVKWCVCFFFFFLNTLSRFLIVFLSRSKCLLISWLQSLSAVIFESKKIKSVTVSVSPHLFIMK